MCTLTLVLIVLAYNRSSVKDDFALELYNNLQMQLDERIFQSGFYDYAR